MLAMQNRVYFSAGMAAVVVGAHVIFTLVVPAVPDNTGGSGTEGDSAYKKTHCNIVGCCKHVIMKFKKRIEMGTYLR